MSKRSKKTLEMPSRADLESELHREKYKKRYWQVLRNTVFTLITVAAVAVLVATLLLPVLEIYGTSMSPSLKEGDIVVSVKAAEFKHFHDDVFEAFLIYNVGIKKADYGIRIDNAWAVG